jgi:ferric-dicitrate binding protein FerR (iron transport regulator)
MSGRHATAGELELYVLGALDAGRVDSFEAHCAVCDTCAAALSGEASLEIAFEQVAARTARGAAVRPWRAVAYGAAGVMAMAAAALLWIGRSSPAVAVGAGEATAAGRRAPMDDGAIIFDARNDALDGG